MRIYGRRSGAIWYAAYALLCVCARPMKDRIGETYVGSSSRSSDQETMASSYEFEELSASKSSIDDGLEELEEEEEGLSTMRAITTKTRSNAVLLPLIIEPEAEMLPPGYKGVKPPGVSHMELTTAFEKPRVGVSTRESARTRASGATDDDGDPDRSSDGFDWGGDAYYAASKRETQRLAGDDRGGDSTVVSETDWTNGVRKDGRGTGYVGSSDAGESYSKNENRAKDREDGAVKKRNGIHETDRAGERIAGYRDHYHKGELKKLDAGFYDNKRQGGRFNKRHGRYGERHDAAAERTYAKEKSNDSGLAEVETNKRRKFEKTRVSQDAQGQTTADSSGTWMDS